jgi:ABC-type transport system involved in multi-copper enzyme maturation permease subunit
MAAWRYFFDDPLNTESIVYSISILLAHILVLLSIAFYKFNKKDILS